uniref:RE61257p n=1 Tax=Drosophila melanogaster TaxID=7227 RepID=Q9VUA6_DROME|eukprot:NP_648673.1 uncharacterized protein Dmel_CG13738 [Drosophila melanogaster]
MKYFVICVLAAIVLFQSASGFKRRVIYVVPAPTTSTTTTTTTTTAAPSSSATTTTNAPEVVYQVVYCSWKNNWCRPVSNTVRNCKWGFCKFNG